jgi:hypothetical protein
MSGPAYCNKCGAWPGVYGGLCHLCETRAWCEANQVPLPSDPKMRADIERLLSCRKAED